MVTKGVLGMQIAAHRAFLKSAARDFKRTGAVAPSSRALGCAMTTELACRDKGPVRVLEVGGGTGNITKVIAQAIRPGDSLDVYEIDPEFSAVIKRRLQNEPACQELRSSIRIHNRPIEQIDRRMRYDFIISCLPFTCFEPDMVREIFEIYRGILKPGGVCSFFEYVLIRKAARFVNGSASERRRVAGVAKVVREYMEQYRYKRHLVMFNIPPAIVHHIRFSGA
jgi:phospholipid N-methyltransferase